MLTLFSHLKRFLRGGPEGRPGGPTWLVRGDQWSPRGANGHQGGPNTAQLSLQRVWAASKMKKAAPGGQLKVRPIGELRS